MRRVLVAVALAGAAALPAAAHATTTCVAPRGNLKVCGDTGTACVSGYAGNLAFTTC